MRPSEAWPIWPSAYSSPGARPSHVICDEDPTTSLIERTRLESGATGAIVEQRLGEHILEGIAAPICESPKVWPRGWPNGRPCAFSFLPVARYSSQVSGNLPSL